VSIVRVGLAETRNFAEGYEAIFGKPTAGTKTRGKKTKRAKTKKKPKKR